MCLKLMVPIKIRIRSLNPTYFISSLHEHQVSVQEHRSHIRWFVDLPFEISPQLSELPLEPFRGKLE